MRRDGWELRTDSSPLHGGMAPIVRWLLSLEKIDEELLKSHAETHREGLEARDRLLERIKTIEILEMVRDILGKGEVSQNQEGAALTYRYQKVDEEWESTPATPSSDGGPLGHGTPGSLVGGHRYKTGKWRIWDLKVEEKVGVNFGGYSPESMSDRRRMCVPEMNEFFADRYDRDLTGDIHAPERFVGLPKAIWWRPENLGIYVTIPYALHEVRNKGILQGHYRPNTWNNPFARFDQSVSQQEIMDYLAQRLEAQKTVGQLPSQLEAIELAKIEELQKRGLLAKGKIYEAYIKIVI